MNRNKWLALAVLVVVVMAAAITYYYVTVPVQTNRVNVGWAGGMNEAPTLVAVANGYFSDEGLNVTLVKFDSGPLGLKALVAGEIDVVDSSDAAGLALSMQAGGDIQAFLQVTTTLPGVLVVPASSNITGIKDLVGKKVAVPQLGGPSHIMILALLNQYGVSPSQVTVVPVGGGTQIVAALLNGQVDAAHLPEPFTSTLVLAGKAKAIDVNLPLMDPLFAVAKKQYLDSHANIIKAFCRAYVRALQFTKNNQGAVPTILKHFINLGDAVLARAFQKTVGIFTIDGKLNPDTAIRTMEILVSINLLKNVLPVSEIFRPEFLP